jgi:quercetin dioxygenase-like cupin family protein
MPASTRHAVALFAALLAGAVLGAFALAAVRATPAPVQRVPLAAADNPTGGKGRELGLTKVLIPAHAAIALHRHPGTQVAYIASGTLTYSVKRGGVTVMSGSPGDSPKAVAKIGPGETRKISVGEWIVEQPSTVHSALNATGRPIVIYLATLFPIGSAGAIPVTS